MAIPTGIELLIGGSIGGGATVVGWFANRVIKIGDDMRQIKQAIYGDPDMKIPDGLVATVTATASAVDTIDRKVTDIDGRLSQVEKGCIATHGEMFFREPRTNE